MSPGDNKGFNLIVGSEAVYPIFFYFFYFYSEDNSNNIKTYFKFSHIYMKFILVTFFFYKMSFMFDRERRRLTIGDSLCKLHAYSGLNLQMYI